MKTLCILCFTLVFLGYCQAAQESDNLLPAWQQGDKSAWELFTYKQQNVTWIDGSEVLAAECKKKSTPPSPDHTFCPCDAVSRFIKIDATKSYEFSIFVKSTDSDIENSFGFYVYNENQAKIDGNWKNSKFKISEHRHNIWTRWTAYVLPHFVSDINNTGMFNVHYTNGQDWIWPSTAEYVTLRFQSCHESFHTGMEGESGEDGHDLLSMEGPERPTEDDFDNRMDGDHVNRTWYARPSVQEIGYVQRALPRHDEKVRTFDIADEQDWVSVPNYIGKASVRGQHTAIAMNMEQGTKCYYPWGITSYVLIDPKKRYELSVWIMSTANDLNNFLGFQVFDKEFNILEANSIGDQHYEYHHNFGVIKPYFKRSEDDPTTWNRWNGFILPQESNPECPPDDVPPYFSKGVDWVWPDDAMYIQLRFGACYGDGDNKGKTYFALPRLIESDLHP